MPSGRIHNIINLSSYAVLATSVFIAQQQGLISISRLDALQFSASFAAGTLLLSPDLDLATGKVNSKRYWGILGFLWIPYGMMFSHRGFSHTWLIGPLTRLIYLALIVGLVWGILKLGFPQMAVPQLPSAEALKVFWPLLAGYYLSQWLHLIADGIWPDHDFRHLF